MSKQPKFINADEVASLIDPNELLNAIEQALGNFSQGEDGGVVQPVRSVVPVNNHHGFLLTMPAYSALDDALATKVVTYFPYNRAKAREWILYFDATSGNLEAIIDGESITAQRTAMASAVATKHLANPRSKILALLGSGVQAKSHCKALCTVQSFDEVRIWSRNQDHAQTMAGKIGARACATAEEAVRDADVICTLTFATTPVLKAEWVKPGAHINAVGACRADWQELDSELMRSAVVYVDSRAACAKESGDVILSGCEVFAEMGEVINGEKQAFWEKTTVFKSVGMAIEDVISAKLVYDKYKKKHSL